MRALTVLLACFLIAGCAGIEIKPGEGSHARREIPPGPGVLTGQQGEFVIYRLEDEAERDTGESSVE